MWGRWRKEGKAVTQGRLTFKVTAMTWESAGKLLRPLHDSKPYPTVSRGLLVSLSVYLAKLSTKR